MFTEINALYVLIVLQSLLIVRQWYLLSRDSYVSKPSKVKYELKKGDSMSLVYSVSCPVSLDQDVTKRRLTVTVNEVEVSNAEFHYNVSEFGEYSFNEGDEVTLSLVNIDNAGNVSEPCVSAFIAKDTIPPSAPEGLGVALLREDHEVVNTTPEPEVDVTPEPEPVEPEVSPSGSYE